MNYDEYLASEHWKLVALEAKERTKCCVLCGRTRRLEAHHADYRHLGYEQPGDVIVLCWRCHRKHHDTLEARRRRELREGELFDGLLPFDPVVPEGVDNN